LALVVCFSTATAAYTKRAPFYNAWPRCPILAATLFLPQGGIEQFCVGQNRGRVAQVPGEVNITVETGCPRCLAFGHLGVNRKNKIMRSKT